MNIYGKYIKRLLDILFAILFMFILILPMIFIGILVFLYDWDYPLFIQKRYGLNSETFNIIKIRTMKKDTPEVANGKFMDMKFYLTPLGGFLRKTSLDEIPQLFMDVTRLQMTIRQKWMLDMHANYRYYLIYKF